jgi:hypothetical protein
VKALCGAEIHLRPPFPFSYFHTYNNISSRQNLYFVPSIQHEHAYSCGAEVASAKCSVFPAVSRAIVLIKEAASTSEASANFYPITQQNIPQDTYLFIRLWVI